jgi:hypothetical protein
LLLLHKKARILTKKIYVVFVCTNFDGKNRAGELLGFFNALRCTDWIPSNRRGNQAKNYGKFSERFQPLVFIYRAVNSGMVSMGEVNRGEVTLVDLVEINHYLDALDDVQYFSMEETKLKNRWHR